MENQGRIDPDGVRYAALKWTLTVDDCLQIPTMVWKTLVLVWSVSLCLCDSRVVSAENAVRLPEVSEISNEDECRQICRESLSPDNVNCSKSLLRNKWCAAMLCNQLCRTPEVKMVTDSALDKNYLKKRRKRNKEIKLKGKKPHPAKRTVANKVTPIPSLLSKRVIGPTPTIKMTQNATTQPTTTTTTKSVPPTTKHPEIPDTKTEKAITTLETSTTAAVTTKTTTESTTSTKQATTTTEEAKKLNPTTSRVEEIAITAESTSSTTVKSSPKNTTTKVTTGTETTTKSILTEKPKITTAKATTKQIILITEKEKIPDAITVIVPTVIESKLPVTTQLSVIEDIITTSRYVATAKPETTATTVNTAQGVNPTTQGVNPTTQGVNPTTQGVNPTTQGVNPTTQILNPITQILNPTTQILNPTTQIVTSKENEKLIPTIQPNTTPSKTAHVPTKLSETSSPTVTNLTTTPGVPSSSGSTSTSQTSTPNSHVLPPTVSSSTDGNQQKDDGSIVIIAGEVTKRVQNTSFLLAVLLLGNLFFLAVIVLFILQAYESYKKKDYTQVDYLINGMYAESDM
ncbi:uncharacterized protein [Dendrobates tinctorius]|uniref:uncharacterized protein isoform X2 n=1 Tax=Dendrobates tinctorius TaxID=92724 RepID=UPI003CC9F689